MQKKIIRFVSVLLCLCFLTVAMAGCETAFQKNEKIQIVTTIFPLYDWICSLVGDNFDTVEVTMLLDNGVDLHSFQPTAADMIAISTCDLFVYVGGESDEWVTDALAEAVNPDMKVINLMDILGDAVKTEELKEGMQAEEAEEEAENDEHIWLSLKNAETCCAGICDSLVQLDPEHAEDYKANYDAYYEKLDKLDSAYAETVAHASVKTILFADRFPFRYLVDDYQLDYYAAFVGCSAETEAAFETIAFLAEKVDALGLSAVLTLEGTNHKIASTIIASTKNKNQKILSLNSMQSVTSADVKAGTTYLAIMEKNLSVLSTALQ